MTTQNKTYLKRLFKILQPGCVVTVDWLEAYGISRDLQKYYLKSGWLESIGRSAYKKPGDKIEWQGALNAIQKQTATNVHVGGLSALALQGYSHYFRMNNESLQLFSPLKTKLPKWFTDYNWGLDLQHHLSSFLPSDLGIKVLEQGQIQINVSTPERAIMECLYLAPQKMDLVECFHIFEGLVNLKPKLVNELLTQCNSVKVKRLFLYMTEKANHQWLTFLKTDKIDIGTGNRMLAEKGVHVPKYLLSIPKELADL
ncbi:type IV toxin-antitoxin system AbiEi family antitoxin [Sunxiuqinia indica]|uniref:type IV toxin-antitoxin system AbiEi family antitoxin n=1 Tax=Sunxiuqinia indica TaxID=2692584 RepID=UPI00135B8381|nr:type IV toxin-antitoxin system AbiEi family antitoxin [Sunxiuqinia indica]